VTSKEYRQLIQACKDGGYALPAVNVMGTNVLNAVMECAAKNKSDVIIQMSDSGARFFAGEGLPDAHKARVLGRTSVAQHVHLLAEGVRQSARCSTRLAPTAAGALGRRTDRPERNGTSEKIGKPLFSSHMLDLSRTSRWKTSEGMRPAC